jgi:DUF917 family protein
MKTLSKDEITDLAYGASFLGTGGGGDRSSGLNLIGPDVDSGRHFKLASFDELGDDGLVVSPYYVGAVGHSSSKAHLTDTAYGATRVLKHYLNENLGGIIAAELGGFATLGALHVAGMEDVPLLDADAAGRAAPDLQCSMFYVGGIKMTPFSVYTEQEDQMIVKSISSDSQAELIVRRIASVTGSSVGVCDHPGRAKEIKAASVEGTISRSIDIGKKIRKGSIDGFLEDRSIHKLFRGYLRSTKSEIREGFTYGNYLFEGTEEYKGKTMKVWFKNENLISWVDDRIYVTSPDLISITTMDLIPISNPIREEGKEYFLFGLPADAKWRTPKGLEVMGPRFFGYNVDYLPIEKVI